MPKAKKNEVRELDLTRSFVAGGFSYHSDPRDVLQLGANGNPIVFFRFEDSDNRRTALTSDDFYNTNITPKKIVPVLSSTFGSNTLSTIPLYDTKTPYKFINSIIGDRLTTDSSHQVRSLSFGSNAGVFTSNLGTAVKVDNISPTTSVKNAVEGNDHVALGVQDDTLTLSLLSPFKAITISGWINTGKTELIANFGGGFFPEETKIHYRPIFRSTRTDSDDSNEEALISFGHIVSLINPNTNGYYQSNLHKRLYFRYKDSYGSTASEWISKEPAQIVDGEWAHVSVVVAPDSSANVTSNTVVRFYCNGKLLGTVPYSVQPSQSKSISETAIDYAIGGVEDSDYSVTISNLLGTVKRIVGSFFIGNIDDVAVWNRSLSGDELAAIYHAHRGAYPPGSGYLNNPPRTMIIEQDNKAGSYPAQTAPGDTVLNAPLYSDELTVETPKVNAELDLNFIDIPEHLSKIVFSEGSSTPSVTANWSSVTVGLEVDIGDQLFGGDGIQENDCVYTITGFDAVQQDSRGGEFFLTSTGRMTYIKVQAPCDGVMNIGYGWNSAEFSNDLTYDWPFYDVTSYEPTTNDIADAGTTAPDPISGASGGSFASSTPGTGTITISYSAGDWISIGVYSIDSVGGAGTLVLANENVMCGLTCPGICGNEIAVKFYRENPVPQTIPTLESVDPTTNTWGQVKSSLGGSAIISQDSQDCSWEITGFQFASQNANPSLRLTYVKIQAPCDGVLCFDWSWSCPNPGNVLDFAYWAIYSTEPTSTTALGTIVISEIMAQSSVSSSGTSCISYKKDQWIVIGVASDGIAGTGTLNVANPANNPSYAVEDPMCGLQCQGCGSITFPVDITDVIVPNAIKNPKLLAEDVAIGGPYREVNSAQNNLELSIKNVVDRFVRAGNLEAVRSLLSIEFKSISSGRGVKIRQLLPGPAGNIPIYPRSLARNGEPQDERGYKLLPYPRGVGLQSVERNQVFYFTGGKIATARFPFGAPIDEDDPTSARNSLFKRVLASPNAGSVSVVGSGISSLIGGASDQHPTCEFTPYNETNAVQAFGVPEGSQLYGTQGEISDTFFTRGTTVGPLDEALRNKDRIVIDLTPSAPTTLAHRNTLDSNYPMAYYNFSTRQWDPIGLGQGISAVLTGPGASTLVDALETQYLGFSQGFRNLHAPSSAVGVQIIDDDLRSTFTGTKRVFNETGWLSPIDTFGFPLHPKYHATSSQQLPASLIVDRPFLVESIVYEFSASMPNMESRLNLGITTEYRAGGAAFFILNQRKANPDPGQEASYTKIYVSETGVPANEYSTPQDGGVDGIGQDYWTINYEHGGIPQTRQLSAGGPVVYVDAVRDLLTYARIGTVWPSYDEEIDSQIEPGFPHPAKFMDLAIEVPASQSFSGKYTVAAPVRAPSQCSAYANILLGAQTSEGITSVWASRDSSTRNAIDIATGRAYRGEFFGPEIAYRSKGFLTQKFLFAPSSDSIESPYLIMPGDQLVFGWQSPSPYYLNVDSDDATSGSFNILPGAGKLILYGSYLHDEKPVHNIFKECLTSDALHESIPGGPWVLDRFETDPQMSYTGSLRELYVTGTMVTRGEDGKPVVTDLSKFNSGSKGVRMVGASVSSGNVKQRWSFFRNYRVSCFDEQYYDSMQPDPISTLFAHEGCTARPLVGNSTDDVYAIIMPEGTYSGPGAFSSANTYANRAFIGSFPFESIYSGIPRVPYINAGTINRQQRTGIGVDSQTSTEISLEGKNFVWIGFGDTTDRKLTAKGSLLKQGLPTSQVLYTYSTDNTGVLDTNPVISDLDYSAIGTGSNLDIDDIAGKKINYHLSRFTGCFGNGYKQLCTYTEQSTFFISAMRGMNYRGARHGLINPIPQYSTVIFNGTHYGQFRDMLEQRQYTRFYLSDSSITNAAAEVVFIDRNAQSLGGINYITSGSATNSSNISPFATSEHPYDDSLSDYGLIWDRNSPLPEDSLAL